MPVPIRTQHRYQAQGKFNVGDRLVHRDTGEIYIMGVARNVRECWVMRLNPGAKTLATWGQILSLFDKEELNASV